MTMSLINPYLRLLIPKIVLVGYVICLCLTNISIHYISRSIPSLYGRLDFFQSTAYSSHTIKGTLGLFQRRAFTFSHSKTRAFVFCLAYPTRRGPSYFVSHPLVVADDLAYPLTPVLSAARLGTCASSN